MGRRRWKGHRRPMSLGDRRGWLGWRSGDELNESDEMNIFHALKHTPWLMYRHQGDCVCYINARKRTDEQDSISIARTETR
jgi:hypothetical protein